MKKKVLIIITIILIAIIAFVSLYFILNKQEQKTVDIDLVSQNINALTPFNEIATMDITTEELSNLFQINTENVEKVVGKMPMMNVHASMYVLIQAKEGSVETVKAELEAYAKQYEEQWSMYLPEQYELVQNRKVGVIGNTIYMIIAENAETLEQELTK